jgi:hypothetical protein
MYAATSCWGCVPAQSSHEIMATTAWQAHTAAGGELEQIQFSFPRCQENTRGSIVAASSIDATVNRKSQSSERQ